MDELQLISTLPLEVVSKVNFFDEDNNPLDKAKEIVGDYGTPLERRGSPLFPIMAIRGFYQNLNNLDEINFYINKKGGHLMYFSVTPKSVNILEFYFKTYSMVAYWEDDKYRYLIQVCEIN